MNFFAIYLIGMLVTALALYLDTPKNYTETLVFIPLLLLFWFATLPLLIMSWFGFGDRNVYDDDEGI